MFSATDKRAVVTFKMKRNIKRLEGYLKHCRVEIMLTRTVLIVALELSSGPPTLGLRTPLYSS